MTTERQAKQAIHKQGPCGICGGPYAAHRIIATQMERIMAGDDINYVADDYDLTVAAMVTHWHAFIEVLYDDLAAS